MASWRDAVGAASILVPAIAIWICLRRFVASSRAAWDQAEREQPKNGPETDLGNNSTIPNLVYRKLHAGTSPPDLPLWRSAFFTALLSIGFVLFWTWKHHVDPRYAPLWPGVHVILWSVMPPVFFFYQWRHIYAGLWIGPEYERFKMGQDLATKVWAAIALILGAIYKFGGI
jgi:hypothetical protein